MPGDIHVDQIGLNHQFKPELLAPAGNMDKCRIALLYGADAIYCAGKDFSLRGFTHNLSSEQLAEALFFAHIHRKKIYVAVNVFARQADLKELPAYLEYLQHLSVDALIISDPGVLLLARRHAPRIPVHLSTQANTTNSLSMTFWRDQGVSRINLARELSFSELAEIAESANREQIEIEVFVHGAMCMSYSGRCLISAYLNRRSANSGYCTQPCRWSYRLVEEKRPGEFFPVVEDHRGTFIFNSKDLCLVEHIAELSALGISSFKIEGRMKGALYLASVTQTYRRAIDNCFKESGTTDCSLHLFEDLLKVSHRPYTKGLLFDDPAAPANTEGEIDYVRTHTLAGIVRVLPESVVPASFFIEARSTLKPGQVLEFIFPDGSCRSHVLDQIEDMAGNILPQAHPNSWIKCPAKIPAFPSQVVRTHAGRQQSLT